MWSSTRTRRMFFGEAIVTAAAVFSPLPEPGDADHNSGRPLNGAQQSPVSTYSAPARGRPDVESLLITSKRLRRELRISFTRLLGAGNGNVRPVELYVLDPSFNFSVAVAVADFLAGFARLARGRWPDLSVIGVGYPTDDPRGVMTARARDLTPTSSAPPPGVQLPTALGGAADFLAALQDDVRPAIDARNPGERPARVLVGHSLGGLFGLYTLLHTPEAFAGYLLISPSLWWNDRVTLRYEQAWRDRSQALRTSVFLAVGDGEQTTGSGWRNESFPDEAIRAVRQVDNFREFGDILRGRKYDGLRLQSVVISGEHHLTVFPAAFTRGLQWMVEELR